MLAVTHTHIYMYFLLSSSMGCMHLYLSQHIFNTSGGLPMGDQAHEPESEVAAKDIHVIFLFLR